MASPRRLWPEWPPSLGFGLLAFGALLTFLASWAAFLYTYVIAISAGLCGDGRKEHVLATVFVAPYLVVGSWALRERDRVLWAWPLAVFAAAAVAVLVAYVSPSAHGFCET